MLSCAVAAWHPHAMLLIVIDLFTAFTLSKKAILLCPHHDAHTSSLSLSPYHLQPESGLHRFVAYVAIYTVHGSPYVSMPPHIHTSLPRFYSTPTFCIRETYWGNAKHCVNGTMQQDRNTALSTCEIRTGHVLVELKSNVWLSSPGNSEKEMPPRIHGRCTYGCRKRSASP